MIPPQEKALEASTRTVGADQQLTVFISYSRADHEFADRLVTALETRGLRVLIDRRDLPLLEEWQHELLALIRQADAVVFIVSPASVTSKVCEWEVAQVAGLNKRLAPIVAKDVPADAPVPAAIGKINFVSFTEDAQFENEADKLVRALNTDLTWIKEHTRLGERSWLWLERERADALLLRGSELNEAERWLLTHPREATAPTALHREFVQESRNAEQARTQREREQLERTRRFQRRAGWALGAFSGLLFVAALATAWQVRETSKKESSLFAGKAAQWNDKGHCDQAMRFAVLALPTDDALPLFSIWSVEAEAQLMRAMWGCPLLSRIILPHVGVSSAAFAPGDKMLLAAGKDGTARLIDLVTGREIDRLKGHKDSVEWASFSQDGVRAVTAGRDKVAIVWDVATRQETSKLVGHQEFILTALFSPDGRMVVTASNDWTARLWDAATGEERGRLDVDAPRSPRVSFTHPGGVTSASFSPDGRWIITTGKDEVARIWDAATHRLRHTLKGHSGWVTWATFSPNGDRVVTTGHDKTARVWDTRTGKPVVVLQGHTDALHAAAFSPTDGRVIATGSMDTSVRLWDAETGRELDRIDGHAGAIWSVAFSADAKQVISASDDQTIRISSTTNVRKGRKLFEADKRLESAQFNSAGSEIVGWTTDGTVRIWDVTTGRQVRASKTAIDIWAIAPDGTSAATVIDRTIVKLVDWSTGKDVLSFPSEKSDVANLRFNADGSRLVVVRADNTLRVWDVRTGMAVSPSLHHDGVVGAAFSPDSRRLLTFGLNKKAAIWDIAQGKMEGLANVSHDQGIYIGEFSSDGDLLVTGSRDNSVWIVDAAGRGAAFRLWHKYWVESADFNRNGDILVTASDKIYLWHTRSGTELAVFESPVRYEIDVKFGPEGKMILAWGDRSAYLFDVALLSAHSGPELRRFVCNTSLARAAEFSVEEMRDIMLGGHSEMRAPCSRSGPRSAAYWTRLAHRTWEKATCWLTRTSCIGSTY